MEELDLKELLQIIWEKRLQIILIVAIFMAIGIIYTLGFVTPKYESVTTLLLATNSSGESTGLESITTTDVTLNSNLVSTYSDLVTSNKVTRNVISNLALNVGEDVIKNNVSVTARTGKQILEITVRNEDPVLAAKIANEIAKVFIEEVKGYYGMENVYVVDEAEVEQAPYNINHTKDVMIFAAIGLVIALGYIIVSNMLDTTIKSSADIEKISGITVLASIPVYESNEGKGKSAKRSGGKR